MRNLSPGDCRSIPLLGLEATTFVAGVLDCSIGEESEDRDTTVLGTFRGPTGSLFSTVEVVGATGSGLVGPAGGVADWLVWLEVAEADSEVGTETGLVGFGIRGSTD